MDHKEKWYKWREMKEEVRTLQRENEQDMGFDGIWRVRQKEEPEIAMCLVAVRDWKLQNTPWILGWTPVQLVFTPHICPVHRVAKCQVPVRLSIQGAISESLEKIQRNFLVCSKRSERCQASFSLGSNHTRYCSIYRSVKSKLVCYKFIVLKNYLIDLADN